MVVLKLPGDFDWLIRNCKTHCCLSVITEQAESSERLLNNLICEGTWPFLETFLPTVPLIQLTFQPGLACSRAIFDYKFKFGTGGCPLAKGQRLFILERKANFSQVSLGCHPRKKINYTPLIALPWPPTSRHSLFRHRKVERIHTI